MSGTNVGTQSIGNEVGGTRQRIARIARGTLIGSGALAASMGPLLMSGRMRVLPVHEVLGDIAILSLWTLAAVAARSGVSKGKVALAAIWGLVVLSVGSAQKLPYGATVHTLTQVLHVASVMGLMVGGMLLARTVLTSAPANAVGTLAEAAAEFLAKKRIAVTGVSRSGGGGHGGNVVYRRLKERGYQAFAVNPNADTVEGDRAYPDLSSIPGGVDAVVIATRPEIAEDTMRECAELGITQVWMHRGPGAGSVSDAATAYGRQHGITVIDGGCPLMFPPTADFGHKVMRFVYSGKIPKQV